MKLATYRLTPDAPGAPLYLPPGASWTRFGDKVLLFSCAARWDALTEERPGKGSVSCQGSTLSGSRVS
jgi:hypothetical protein